MWFVGRVEGGLPVGLILLEYFPGSCQWGFWGVRVGIQPLCVISDDPGVDEAAEIKRFGSELGHGY